ncbi:hypothetical protein DL546_008714 [Coniochaeta pulveracea]|uniref:Uncharacterized protein n=1 Tax=Coniochaeta pulveracea TaxID=177199 RepID=A0A420YL33_9PEZI|nr:hypothetical protein DL546_008714 [Coniochaeta pulveracea]
MSMIINSLKAPYAEMLGTTDITAIRKSLGEDKSERWGFVLIRCTYSSQEAWEKFLRLAKQDAYDYFEQRGMEESDVYANLVWTVIEDADTLDGASYLDTSRRFEAWLESEGKHEKREIKFPNMWRNCPRYSYFLHVDQESLESVVDDEKAKTKAGYYCMMVQSGNVLLAEAEAESENEWATEDEDEDEDAFYDQRKRVHVHELVSWYALLLWDENWYHVSVDDGIANCF